MESLYSNDWSEKLCDFFIQSQYSNLEKKRRPDADDMDGEVKTHAEGRNGATVCSFLDMSHSLRLQHSSH